MTISDMVDRVRDFLNEDVCTQIKLKKAKDIDTFEFEMVHPVAYSVHRPYGNQESSMQAPSITVIPTNGEDQQSRQDGTCKFRLLCLVWDPGQHTLEDTNSGSMQFEPTTEGWRDLANLIDVIRREIGNRDNIGGLAVEYPIQYELYVLDENGNPLPEFVDYRAGWVDFTARYANYTHKTYDHLL